MWVRFSILSVFFLSLAAAAGDELRPHLERCYKAWRGAVVTKNEMIWRQVTAEHRKMSVKNRVISEKRRFPQAVFDLPAEPPAIDGLTFLATKRSGPTARSYYFGDVMLGELKSPNNLLVISFVGGGNTWLYDHAELINLVALPEVRKQLEQGDTSYIDTNAEILPSGVIPPTPAEVKEAPFIAKVYVFCPGRDLQVQINKVSRHGFANDKQADIVIGGARSGTNEVQYVIKDLAGYEGGDPLAIRVYLLSQVPGVKPIKAYEYLVQAGEQPLGFGKGTFEVTSEIEAQLLGKP